MKMFNETTKVRPVGANCVVDLNPVPEELYTDVITMGNIEAPDHVRIYKGVISEANDESIVGKHITMSEFSGLHLAYEHKIAKLVPISDILTMSETKELTVENLKPVAKKLLVEIIEDDKDDLTFTADDPRVANLLYAKVLKVGDNCENCKVGDIIGIDPYEGEVILSNPVEYRVLLDFCVKLIIEK